jgi:hypothetical protein
MAQANPAGGVGLWNPSTVFRFLEGVWVSSTVFGGNLGLIPITTSCSDPCSVTFMGYRQSRSLPDRFAHCVLMIILEQGELIRHPSTFSSV